MRRLLPILAFLVLGGPVALRAADDLAARTVVLVNSREPESVGLGEFYLAQRGIPAANLVALPMPAEETITWRRFVDEVWQPLQDELVRRGWLEGVAGRSLDAVGRRRVAFVGHRLAYLVVCRGTPLRVENDPLLVGNEPLPPAAARYRTNQCAVDSELSLLAVGNHDINGFLANPLFQHERILPAGADLVIKVSRLDGPSDAAARHLVTSALAAEAHGLAGRYYVDLMPTGSPSPDGDRWLAAARDQLDGLGFDGDTDGQPGTFEASARFDAPAVYLGWYAPQANGPFLREGFAFPPGAIAVHIHSFSASTLRSDSAGWCGPLVARGAAATVGNVFEPYLQLTHRPDLLVEALVRGHTLGDAAYYALPFLSWQSVVIGDPLYRPFKVPLDDQLKHLDDLPAGLAPYVVIREARRLDLGGRHDEAAAVRAAARHRFGGLPLELDQVEAALKYGRPAPLTDLAAKVSGPINGAEWPLVRQAARLLLRGGAAGRGLEVYRRLADTAPDPDAARRLLTEARQAAETSGDAPAAQEFARRLDEKIGAPPAPPGK